MKQLIQHGLDQSADRTPQAVAFRCGESSLTYAACAERTDQLARALREQGVRRGDRVGIYLHKSLESAIAIYGILKAGAAYVPIDPRFGPAALSHVLKDCDVAHVISEKSKLGSLSGAVARGAGVKWVTGAAGSDTDMPFETMDWNSVKAVPSHRPAAQAGLKHGDLAYIMYTSGSTGRPKGIVHTHESGLSYAVAAAELYGLGPDDILSNHSHLHFDMSTFDYFSGPVAGATTVIIPEPYMLLPGSLSELIEEERMTVWYSVSSALVDLLLRGALEERDLSSLRWVNFGGEPFPPNHLRDLMALIPGARFSNVYGPAEVNQCTYFHVPPLPNEYEESQVPIGRTWEIAEALVLDTAGEPARDGEQGELLIASVTRMQGYWKDPALTEASFLRVRTPGETPEEKVFYRTGDLVRRNERGELEFLGRLDRQVKFRGFRVELDGIEAVLTKHPQIAESAVWVDDAEKPAIKAAVLLRDEGVDGPGETDLLRHARENLPHYAVPESVAVLAAFPRTGSGKIDRRAVRSACESRGEKDLEQEL